MSRNRRKKDRSPGSSHCHAASPPAASPRSRTRLSTRVVAFVVLAVASLAAVALVWPRTGPANAAAEATVQVDMSGYSPAVLTAKAGEPLRVQIVNPDSALHTDGAGWHQLAIPALGVDARIGPRSQSTIDIPAAAPGEYTFYCDICCGGKENPAMQGVLKVTA